MKKSDVLKQQRAALELELKPLLEVADLNDEQKRLFDVKTTEITSLNENITREEKREAMLLNMAGPAAKSITEKEEREIGAFSFQRAIRSLCDNKAPDGLEAEMHQEGVREFNAAQTGGSVRGFVVPLLVLNTRASSGQNVTTAADGGNLVQSDPMIFIQSLKNALVMTKLGANFLTGLVGNLPLVGGGAFTPSWIAEGNTVTITKEAFSKAIMTPKNLMVAGAISKMLLNQTGYVADQLIRNELVAAIALGIEAAAINGAGAPAPTGILNIGGIGSEAGGTNGLAPVWANMVNLESCITTNNVAGTIGYLTNAKVAGKLKQTLKSANVAGYIMEGGQSNGASVAITNAVPSNLVKGTSGATCSAIIAGIWSNLFIGMWGGLDMIVDPYTGATANEVKLVFNQFADVALRQPTAFAAMKDALTV